MPVDVQNRRPDVRLPIEAFQHRRQGRAKIDVALSVLRLHVRLDYSSLGFLSDVECSAIVGDVLSNLEAESFSGSHWTTSS